MSPKTSTDTKEAATSPQIPPSRPTRILIISADVGEGHTAAARNLAHDLTAEDPTAEVIVSDGLRALGFSLERLIRDGYRFQLRVMPWSYSFMYWFFAHVKIARALGRAVLALLGSRPLLALVSFYEPDVIVSTHPAITSVLGHLRRRRLLEAPACATITDLADYKLWAHPGVDLHLVMHDDGIKPVEGVAGKGSVRRVRPLVAPAFLQRTPQGEARQALGFSETGPLIVVSGGGWGVGNLATAVSAALAVEQATVVCLAGRNDVARRRLEQAYAGNDRVVVLGFTERMNELLAAADCLVHSTGGVTSLEALACGCPLVSYGGLGGHARVHNRTLLRLGLAEFAETPGQLKAVIDDVLSRPRTECLVPPDGTPEPASLVMSARPRVRPLPAWQPTFVRAATTLAVAMLIGVWGFSTDELYPVAAKALPIRPVTNVHTQRAEVGLVIHAPQSAIPAIASHLQQSGQRASFALSEPPTANTEAALDSAQSKALPTLSGEGGLTRSLHTRKRLRNEASALGLHHRFYYLMPRSGYTLGQYVESKAIGASPVAGAVRIMPTGPMDSVGSLRPGEVAVVNLTSGSPAELARLDDLVGQLSAKGLTGAPVDELAPARTQSPTPALGPQRPQATSGGGPVAGPAA